MQISRGARSAVSSRGVVQQRAPCPVARRFAAATAAHASAPAAAAAAGQQQQQQDEQQQQQKRPRVVATREAGKNGKFMAALAARGLEALELPLIEHAPGPDR
jgi:predicted NAD-dependent protein-ADP-ribosyltransferase YbiA (DUF1768 family)